MKTWFKENDVVKVVLLSILVVVLLTWIVPNGSLNGLKFAKVVDSANKAVQVRIGLFELSMASINAIQFFMYQLLFVLTVGIFYGIISKTNGYKKLIESTSKKIKGKEIPVVLAISALIALYVSFTSQVLTVFLIIPFIITVLLNAKFDKKTAFAVTFGSVFVGIIGATYGTEGLNYFNYYLTKYAGVKAEAIDYVSTRFIVLIVAYVIFNIFNIIHIKKMLVDKKVDDVKEDTFAVEKVTTKKTKVWPMAIIMVVLCVLIILGYIRWKTDFDIKIFQTFHEELVKIDILKDIIGGTQNEMYAQTIPSLVAFGSYDIYTIIPALFVLAIIAAVIYRLSVSEVIEGAIDGAKKMIKPVLVMLLAYTIFVLVYWSPILPRIMSYILKAKFNVFRTTLGAGLASLFTADFGYIGYQFGTFIKAAYSSNMDKIYVIFPAMYGFIQMIAPTSVILLAGLTYSNVSYKEWIKYIWKFMLILLVALIIIFII